MERKPIVNPRRLKKDPPSASEQAHTPSGSALGRVDVQRKALRIQDLPDKLGFAIRQYESAQEKFEKGQDSYREWENIIKLLNAQIKDVNVFVAVAHHNLGVIHAGRKEFPQARDLLHKAIEINPEYAVAYYNLALVYKNLGDMNKAREYMGKARELGYPPRDTLP